MSALHALIYGDRSRDFWLSVRWSPALVPGVYRADALSAVTWWERGVGVHRWVFRWLLQQVEGVNVLAWGCVGSVSASLAEFFTFWFMKTSPLPKIALVIRAAPHHHLSFYSVACWSPGTPLWWNTG